MNTDLADSANYGGTDETHIFSIHGSAAVLENAVADLSRPIERLLGSLRTPLLPPSPPIFGTVRPYDPAECAPYLSETASRLESPRTDIEPLEVFEEGSRFWAIDERWGMSAIDLQEGTFRSWVLPDARINPLRCVEAAVIWPMAQLLRSRGITLIPAVSMVREGWSVLLVSPAMQWEPHIRCMMEGGYRLIGQRWTALREEDDRIAMMQMPGWVERPMTPRLRIAGSDDEIPGCSDAAAEHRKGVQSHAFCDAILIGESSTSGRSSVRDLSNSQAEEMLKAAWPMMELDTESCNLPMAGRLAADCRVAHAELSRDARDILGLLDTLRYGQRTGISIAA